MATFKELADEERRRLPQQIADRAQAQRATEANAEAEAEKASQRTAVYRKLVEDQQAKARAGGPPTVEPFVRNAGIGSETGGGSVFEQPAAQPKKKTGRTWDPKRQLWLDPEGKPATDVQQSPAALKNDSAAQARLQNQTRPPATSQPAAAKAPADDFYKQLSDTVNGSRVPDRDEITKYVQSIAGERQPTHNDAVTANDVTLAESHLAQAGHDPAAQENALANLQAVRAAYQSPANQNLIENFGGEQRIQDLKAISNREAGENKANYAVGRDLFGADAAAKMTAEELRTSVRDFYANSNPNYGSTPSSDIVQQGVARGAINPTSPSDSALGQIRGTVTPQENTPTNYNTAFVSATTPSPLNVPTVAEMRDRLNDANSVVENARQSDIQQQTVESNAQATAPAQPPQAPPPAAVAKNEDEENTY